MIKITELEKFYRTEEVETIALNKLSMMLIPANLWPSWARLVAVNQPC
jgi:hypothetical protein